MSIIKKISLIFLLGIFTVSLNAQSYKNSLGLRFGGSSGISYKQFLNSNRAVEIIGSFPRSGLQLTGLYQIHKNLNPANLKFYYGVGGHVGIWDDRDRAVWFRDDQNFNQVIVGFDGILGLAYDFQEVPINLSLDWKPEVNLASYRGVWVGDIALSVRYCW